MDDRLSEQFIKWLGLERNSGGQVKSGRKAEELEVILKVGQEIG